MKTKYLLRLVFTFLLSGICFSQATLVQLENIEGSYMDDDSYLIVPKFNIKQGDGIRLYNNDKLIFTPEDKFKHCIYQVWNNRYFVITAFTPRGMASTPELRVKNEVAIIDTESWDKLYYFDLKGSTILDIYESIDGSIGVNTVKPKDIQRFEPIKN